MSTAKIARYGAQWAANTDPLKIELECIRFGGKWVSATGKECGAGLFEHYMNARKMLWPRRYRHRWTDLVYENVLGNMVTILMGPASCQKSGSLSELACITYWASPQNTAVLVTSTTKDKMQGGVFSEITMLWQEGKLRFPWLAGHPIEYKMMITTDNIDEMEVRDFRRGIMGKPCVPTGTLIDTPTGNTPIENLKVGDRVLCASGVGVVKETMSRICNRLVRVRISDGRTIDCTENHEFLTNRGWVKSIDLETFDRVFSVNETLQVLRDGHWSRVSEPEILFTNLSGQKSSGELQVLQRRIQTMEAPQGQFLQHSLCGQVGVEKCLHKGKKLELPELQEGDCGGSFQSRLLLGTMPKKGNPDSVPQMWDTLLFDTAFCDSETTDFLQSILLGEMEREKTKPKFKGPNKGGDDCLEPVSALRETRVLDQDWNKTDRRTRPLVESGPCISGHQTGRGVRRRSSPNSKSERKGPAEGRPASFNWVDRVEILEQGSGSGFEPSEGGYRVHNIEVEGHPSYSVNGVITHNCFKGSTASNTNYVGLGVFAGIKQTNMWLLADELQFMAPTFLDCITNLRSNPNFKVVGSGNPNHDPESQLSIAAEPLDGWGSVEENTKSSVWPIRLYGGVCVNLIGTDSPNLDQEEDIYPKLIGREFIKITAHDKGVGSAAYESQVMGRNKMALAKSRVITREVCREGGAHNAALWKGTARTKIHACDPAYGGGDRCISMRGEFGESSDGQMIIRVFPPRLVKINLAMKDTLSPEDQIAISIKQELDDFGIPPENSVYDSFGKGTVGNAFAKVFGHHCPTPINAGERPTKRPVRNDLFVIDEVTKEKRLKRCDEEYGKFITELWFSVRQVIECGQMRELPLDVMSEGCRREYFTVSGNKTDVEPKDQMGGRSPDLFDTLALLVEVARRLGFQISRLGVKVDQVTPEDDYFEREETNYRSIINSNLLIDV